MTLVTKDGELKREGESKRKREKERQHLDTFGNYAHSNPNNLSRTAARLGKK